MKTKYGAKIKIGIFGLREKFKVESVRRSSSHACRGCGEGTEASRMAVKNLKNTLEKSFALSSPEGKAGALIYEGQGAESRDASRPTGHLSASIPALKHGTSSNKLEVTFPQTAPRVL